MNEQYTFWYVNWVLEGNGKSQLSLVITKVYRGNVIR